MIQSETATRLNQILDQDAESVLVWMQKIFAGTFSENEEFSWLLLADVAALNARTGRRNDSGEFDTADCK